MFAHVYTQRAISPFIYIDITYLYDNYYILFDNVHSAPAQLTACESHACIHIYIAA